MSIGDYNNDGDADFITLSGSWGLFRNNINKSGTFAKLSGGYVKGTFVDYDNDGDLNIYSGILGSKDKLYRNNNDRTFTEIPGALGLNEPGYFRTSAWGDYDGDGDMDVYVVNGRQQRSSLYRNDVAATGSFVDVTQKMGVGNENYSYGNGACWSDYDNDGDLDLHLITLSGNHLYRNDVNISGTFSSVGSHLGLAIK